MYFHALQLAEALKGNTSLKVLDIAANNIGPEGIKVLLEALRGNNTLRNLELGYNPIGEEGAKHLADVVKYDLAVGYLAGCLTHPHAAAYTDVTFALAQQEVLCDGGLMQQLHCWVYSSKQLVAWVCRCNSKASGSECGQALGSSIAGLLLLRLVMQTLPVAKRPDWFCPLLQMITCPPMDSAAYPEVVAHLETRMLKA